jgi:antitoxin (DNA-binding transcriptional repressor) of toxin-antitoxin stability system
MSSEQENPKRSVVDVEVLLERFEEFVDRASDGNAFVITKEGRSIAKLVLLH